MAAMAIASLFSSCGQNIDDVIDEPQEVLVFIPKPEVASSSGSQFLYVTAKGEWTLKSSQDWAVLEKTRGNGDENGITLSWTSNAGDEPRDCEILLSCGGITSSAVLHQEGKNAPQEQPDLNSEPMPGWLELPAKGSDGLYFHTHMMSVSGKTVRNWSFNYDPEARVSLWVAYPLNRSLAGSGSRSDAWGLDPKIPAQSQPILYSGYRSGNTGEFLQRGHQIPSADRYVGNSNGTTFYFTNMTPQRGELNERAWATLEGMVRTWSNSFDTLYVVTGADIRGSREYALDNYNNKVTVPVGYYKALLGYKRGGTIASSGKTGGYAGIAFYFDHKAYDSKQNVVMAQSMSIDALESRLGEDFFPNLIGLTSKEISDKVESSVDSWWSNN